MILFLDTNSLGQANAHSRQGRMRRMPRSSKRRLLRLPVFPATDGSGGDSFNRRHLIAGYIIAAWDERGRGGTTAVATDDARALSRQRHAPYAPCFRLLLVWGCPVPPIGTGRLGPLLQRYCHQQGPPSIRRLFDHRPVPHLLSPLPLTASLIISPIKMPPPSGSSTRPDAAATTRSATGAKHRSSSFPPPPILGPSIR